MKRLILVASSLWLGGCTPASEAPSNGAGSGADTAVRACTMIGCESGLRVTFRDGLPAGATVEVRTEGGDTRSLRCEADTPCSELFFREFTPARVSVRVIGGATSQSRTADVTYRSLQPNGPGCPPTCRQGEVRIAD